MFEILPVDKDQKSPCGSSRTGAGRLLRHAGLSFAIVIISTGAASGLGGMSLGLLLHFIQHLAYGYDLSHAASPESFLEGVTQADPARRLIALVVCGFVAGFGWWTLGRFGRQLVSVKATVGQIVPGPSMPFAETAAHALLQISTVALGSPLGREVAPREIGALLATRLASFVPLTLEEIRIVIACGAGAGLSAVYNVPLGGAVFVLEVLLKSYSPKPLVSALAACTVGSMIAWIGLGNARQYGVEPIEMSASIFVGSLVVGPICGVAAYGFNWMTKKAIQESPHNWKRLPWSLAVFVFIGLCASLFPQIPGNGKGPAQLGFDGDLGLKLALELLFLKAVAVGLSLRAGAAGGVLTPSFAIGALIATVFAQIWNIPVPGSPPQAFAVTGAAAFLASSMAMPLTAIVLTIEFTQISHQMWAPILIAVGGSVATFRFCAQAIYRQASASAASQVLSGTEDDHAVVEAEDDRRKTTAPAHETVRSDGRTDTVA